MIDKGSWEVPPPQGPPPHLEQVHINCFRRICHWSRSWCLCSREETGIQIHRNILKKRFKIRACQNCYGDKRLSLKTIRKRKQTTLKRFLARIIAPLCSSPNQHLEVHSTIHNEMRRKLRHGWKSAIKVSRRIRPPCLRMFTNYNSKLLDGRDSSAPDLTVDYQWSSVIR